MAGATAAGRIVCPRCGQNNFDTQAACWSCGAPLRAPAPPAPSAAAAPVRPVNSAAVSPAAAPAAAAYPVAPPATIDPAVALWAGIALAVFFPYIAVPVGIVFLMLDDRRKADIGRVTLVAGLLLTLLHTLVFGWIVGGLIKEAKGFLGGGGAAQIIDRAQQQREPKLNDSLPQGFPMP